MLEPEHTPPIRILLVEDEAIIAQDIKTRLERLGYEVVGVADTAAKALALATETRPDLVFMDIIIQGPLDGVRTAAEMTSRMDVPIIFLTALSDDATIRRVKALKPYGYLVKPFVEHDLQIATELALHRHRSDVQQRLLREAELDKQASLTLVNATLDALDARVAILDDTGTIVGTNRAWREGALARGATLASTSEGQNYLKACAASSEGQVIAAGLTRVLEGEVATFRIEYACHSPVAKAWWSCSVSRFVVGERPRLVVAHHDVTALKLSELERAASEERYQQVLDAISDLVVVRASDSRMLLANRAFRDARGITQTDLQLAAEYQPAVDGLSKQSLGEDARVFATGDVLDIPDEPIAHKDGRIMRAHTVKSPIFNARGQVEMMVAVSRDITERKLMEAHVRLADRMASVGTLAAGVAHEINTPVQFVSDSVHFVKGAMADLVGLLASVQQVGAAVIPGEAPSQMAMLLQEAEEEIDLAYLLENIPKALERALDGIERIATIVKSMREFAHPDQKQMMPADLNRGILNTLTIARNELKYVADEETEFGELPLVTCHIGDLNQVFLNLIVNAAHAMGDVFRDDGIRGCLTVHTWLEGDDVAIAIGDTGKGIPEEIRGQVFDPFFTTKEVGKGTGQGLAIARHIVVERHGGGLTFQSRPGVGTTFFIRLPVSGRQPASRLSALS